MAEEPKPRVTRKDMDITGSSVLRRALMSLRDRGELHIPVPKTRKKFLQWYEHQPEDLRSMIQERARELKRKQSSKREREERLRVEGLEATGHKDLRDSIGDGMYVCALLDSYRPGRHREAWIFSAASEKDAIQKAQEFGDAKLQPYKHNDLVLGWLEPTPQGLRLRIVWGDCLCDFGDDWRECEYHHETKVWTHDHKSYDSIDGPDKVLRATMAAAAVAS